MTFLDAACQTRGVKQAGGPLHYTEVAARSGICVGGGDEGR
ncbi:MAG: hypothetical protein ACE5H9_00505 [Anaerolineae bacterium]